jgi:hypothetical protein
MAGWDGIRQAVAGKSTRDDSTATSYVVEGLTETQCEELSKVCLPFVRALAADEASLQRSRAAYAAAAAAAETQREAGASAALHCRTEVPLLLAVHATDSWAAAVKLLDSLPVRFGVGVSASAIAALGWAATLDDRVGAPGVEEVLAWLQRSCLYAGVRLGDEPLLAGTLEHLRSQVDRAAKEAAKAKADVEMDSGVDDIDFISF